MVETGGMPPGVRPALPKAYSEISPRRFSHFPRNIPVSVSGGLCERFSGWLGCFLGFRMVVVFVVFGFWSFRTNCR